MKKIQPMFQSPIVHGTEHQAVNTLSTSATITGLTNNTTYTFKVKVVNVIGGSSGGGEQRRKRKNKK